MLEWQARYRPWHGENTKKRRLKVIIIMTMAAARSVRDVIAYAARALAPTVSDVSVRRRAHGLAAISVSTYAARRPVQSNNDRDVV